MPVARLGVDVTTGRSWFDPARTRVRAYEVSIDPGVETGYRPGPYVAETYPVEVQQAYVVVHVS